MNYEEWLRIGIIQVEFDNQIAWKSGNKPIIQEDCNNHIWSEIISAMRSFSKLRKKPNIILIPELSLPNDRINRLRKICCRIGSILISGIDYRTDESAPQKIVRNQAIVSIPSNWPENRPSRFSSSTIFGKTFPAPAERSFLKNDNWNFCADPHLYLFKGKNFGSFGVAICYDFLDLERFLLYQGKIQHLFVLAFNKDLNSFYSLAEAMCRTLFCNVVICNAGLYGGSFAISPYYKPYKRTIYKHEGPNLFTSQIIEIPVKELIYTQNNGPRRVSNDGKSIPQEFKNPPPSFFQNMDE